jgi:hypothetical protein
VIRAVTILAAAAIASSLAMRRVNRWTAQPTVRPSNSHTRPKSSSFKPLLQQFAQVRAIALVPEDALTGIPPCSDMIKNAGMFQTQWARHNVFLTLSAMSGKTFQESRDLTLQND